MDEKLAVANRIMDAFVEDTNSPLILSDDDVDIAIDVQTQKVLSQIVNFAPELVLGLSCLYLFLMVKNKNVDVKLPPIGISNPKNRKHFEDNMPQAWMIACGVFDKIKTRFPVHPK